MKKKDLEIIIGFSCNNNCVFCSNRFLRDSLRKKNISDISFAQIKKILESNKSEEIGNLIFVGGEPTISKDFFKIIELAKKLGYSNISIQTNGRMLKNIDFARKICEKNIDIGFSIHGEFASLHDKLTRTPNSFEQLVSGMENLKALGETFTTNTTINKLNYKNIPDLIKFLSRYNPSSILFSLVSPMGNPKDNLKNILPNLKNLRPIIEKSILIAKELNQDIKFMDIPFCIMNGYEEYMQEGFFKVDRQIVVKGMSDIFYLDNKKKKEKTQSGECLCCSKKDICSGLWKEYIELYQDDGLKCIRDKKIKLWEGVLGGALIDAVLSGVKPCARLELVSGKNMDKTINKIKKAGLEYKVFPKEFSLDKTNMKFSLSGNDNEENYVSLFISKDKKIIDEIIKETHSEINTNSIIRKKLATERIGKLLGYPECCTSAFSRIDNYIDDKTTNIRISENTESQFSWILNNLINPYTLIDFYPCSYSCENAINYAKKMFGLVSKSDSYKGDIIKKYLNSVVLYFSFNSYIVFDGFLNNNFVSYLSFESSRTFSEEFMQDKNSDIMYIIELLKKGNRVFFDSINSVNNIKIFKNSELVGEVRIRNESLTNGVVFNFKNER